MQESETALKKSRFTEGQVVAVLKEGETGVLVAELCRKHGMSNATYYQWKSKCSGVQVSELQRLRELEAENAKLKRMYADLALENSAIKDDLNRKSCRRRPGARWSNSWCKPACRSRVPVELQACRGRCTTSGQPRHRSEMPR
jgi:putative transposase